MAEDPPDPASEITSDVSFEAGFDRPYLPTKAEVYSALVAAEGNVAKAARELKATRRHVADIIGKTPEIAALLEDLREGVVDASEDNIYADVKKGDQSASRFVLQTIGKKRGWAQGVEGTGKNGAVEVTIRTFAEEAPSA